MKAATDSARPASPLLPRRCLRRSARPEQSSAPHQHPLLNSGRRSRASSYALLLLVALLALMHAPATAASPIDCYTPEAPPPPSAPPPSAPPPSAPADSLSSASSSFSAEIVLSRDALPDGPPQQQQQEATTTTGRHDVVAAAALTARQQTAAGSGCAGSEGKWNCMTSSWQRCAAGRWSVVMQMSTGTVCTPAGLTDDFKIQHSGGATTSGAPSASSALGIGAGEGRGLATFAWAVGVGLACVVFAGWMS